MLACSKCHKVKKQAHLTYDAYGYKFLCFQCHKKEAQKKLIDKKEDAKNGTDS